MPETTAKGCSCAETLAHLHAFVDRECDEQLTARLQAHVASCPHCKAQPTPYVTYRVCCARGVLSKPRNPWWSGYAPNWQWLALADALLACANAAMDEQKGTPLRWLLPPRWLAIRL